MCSIVAGEFQPPGGVLLDTPYWAVTHFHIRQGVSPGRVMLSLKRHATSFSDLTEEEAAQLGPVISRTASAVEEVLDPARIYLVSFNEGLGHVHFHLLPRMADQEIKGPELVVKHYKDQIGTEKEIVDMASRLADALRKPH